MSQNEISQIGGRYREIKETLTSSNYSIPDNIKEVNEGICQQVLECEVTKRPYKIQPQELIFYIKQGIPIPRRHPDQRFRDRLFLTNPWQLFIRQCDCKDPNHDHSGQCPHQFETTYVPDRSEKVYCEECYRKSII